jgi:transposase-like protein
MSKTCSRGRDAGKERHWREVIRTQKSSGQSVREYCRQVGVKEAAFYWWRRELARRSPTRQTSRCKAAERVARAVAKRTWRAGPGRASSRTAAQGRPAPFLPVEVLTDGTDGGVEIHLGGGRRVCVRPGFDGQTLREVLAALEGRSC